MTNNNSVANNNLYAQANSSRIRGNNMNHGQNDSNQAFFPNSQLNPSPDFAKYGYDNISVISQNVSTRNDTNNLQSAQSVEAQRQYQLLQQHPEMFNQLMQHHDSLAINNPSVSQGHYPPFYPVNDNLSKFGKIDMSDIAYNNYGGDEVKLTRNLSMQSQNSFDDSFTRYGFLQKQSSIDTTKIKKNNQW